MYYYRLSFFTDILRKKFLAYLSTRIKVLIQANDLDVFGGDMCVFGGGGCIQIKKGTVNIWFLSLPQSIIILISLHIKEDDKQIYKSNKICTQEE